MDEPLDLIHRPRSWPILWPVVAFAALFCALLPFDLYLMGALREDPQLKQTLLYGLKYFELFAHGSFSVGLCAVMLLFHRHNRLVFSCMAPMLALTGIVCYLIKLTVGRSRPRFSDLEGSVMDTFVGLFPSFDSSSMWQSLPSSHTSNSVCLVLALSWILPRWWWLWGTLGILGALQRVASEAHYPSDLAAGAAIGWLVGLGVLKWRTKVYSY